MALKISGWSVLLSVQLKRDLWSQLNRSLFSVTHDPVTLRILFVFRDNHRLHRYHCTYATKVLQVPTIRRSALMPFSAQFMYQVVNGVADYPKFLPWCGEVKIHAVDETSMLASILMKKSGLNHWFKTQNVLQPGKSIEISLVEGPFKHLQGKWQFTDIQDQGCKIELELEFIAANGVASTIISSAFKQIANTMVASFCARAQAISEA